MSFLHQILPRQDWSIFILPANGHSFVGMNIPRLGPVSEGLFYVAKIPISWQTLANLPSPYELTMLAESNRRLLQMLIKDGVEIELEAIHDPLAQEMRRLDVKMDVLIDIMGHLLSRELGVPVSRNIWLGKDGLQILLDTLPDGDLSLTDFPEIGVSEPASAVIASGCLVKFNLFLDAHFPQPINLLAKAVLVNTEGDTRLLLATFVEIDRGIHELLEKFIFQQHRRVIALARADSKMP